MITQTKNDSFDYLCPGCGHTDTITLASITAGIEAGGNRDVNMVPLPLCSHCGGWRALSRQKAAAPANHAPDSMAQRKAVNGIHKALVDAGRVLASCADDIAAETEGAADIEALPENASPRAVVVVDDTFKPSLPSARWSASRPGRPAPE